MERDSGGGGELCCTQVSGCLELMTNWKRGYGIMVALRSAVRVIMESVIYLTHCLSYYDIHLPISSQLEACIGNKSRD